MEYYVYQYLSLDGTPYYIGKGKDDRWRLYKEGLGPHPVKGHYLMW